MRYSGSPSYILAFHGCDRSVAERVLSGEQHLVTSKNSYDWLGHGIYFWENNPTRAEEWAKARMKLPGSTIKEPAVVGAVIDLGYCLSLMQADHIGFLDLAFQVLSRSHKKKGQPLPENTGGKDAFLRRLDCAVIQMVHEIHEADGERPFDSVRGLFREGDAVYPGAGFHEGNHIQVCVRNLACIKGYFRPLEL